MPHERKLLASPLAGKKIENTPINKLKPYSKNSRKHPEAQITKLMGSCAEYDRMLTEFLP